MARPDKTMRRESLVLRILWMIVFLAAWYIAVPLLGLVVVAQLLYRLFMGAPSGPFMSFGDSLSQYLGQIGRFAVFNTDEKPWPVADWPTAHAASGEPAHTPKEKTPETAATVIPTAAVAAHETAPDTDLASEASEASEVAEVAEVAEVVEVVEVVEEQEDLDVEKVVQSTADANTAEPKL